MFSPCLSRIPMATKTRLLYVYEERIPERLRDLVRSHIPSDEFAVDEMTYLTPAPQQKEKLGWADVVLFAPGRYLADDILASAKNVRLMQLWSSGYDKFNVTGCTKLGIPVANNGGANAISVAEHAVLLMLAVYKWLPDSHRRVTTGSWAGNSHGLDMFLLHGKKIGIIGFGNIGRQVARKLSGFDADIAYYDIKRADPEIEREFHVRYLPLNELLASSDIVSLHLHANDATENIINEAAIARMKRSAVLINVSRAALVDQQALYRALVDHRLHGAGFDVFAAEPTRPDDPLLLLPNVVVTPHMAGSTYDTYAMVMGRAIENFRRVMRGEAAQWVINKP